MELRHHVCGQLEWMRAAQRYAPMEGWDISAQFVVMSFGSWVAIYHGCALRAMRRAPHYTYRNSNEWAYARVDDGKGGVERRILSHGKGKSQKIYFISSRAGHDKQDMAEISVLCTTTLISFRLSHASTELVYPPTSSVCVVMFEWRSVYAGCISKKKLVLFLLIPFLPPK